jgi:hypothetical protein
LWFLIEVLQLFILKLLKLIDKTMNNSDIENMRNKSGNVDIDSALVSFLYELMRDHLPPGVVEEIVLNSIGDSDCKYTNGWLAKYAEDIANRLTK